MHRCQDFARSKGKTFLGNEKGPERISSIVRGDKKVTVTQTTTLNSRGEQKSISGHTTLRQASQKGGKGRVLSAENRSSERRLPEREEIGKLLFC